MSTPASSHLTAGQRAWLDADLRVRLAAARRQASDHLEGGTHAEHAHAVLTQDADDAPQRDDARAVDQALTEHDDLLLRDLADALARVHRPDYGLCQACGGSIPFDRLKVEPWAARCVPCQAALERPRR